MIMGIKHMAIAVRDANAAFQMYQEILNLPEVWGHEFEKSRTSEAHVTLGGFEIQLCQSWDSDGRFAQYIAEHGDEGVHSNCNIADPRKHSEGWVAFLQDKPSGLETEFMQMYGAGEGPDTTRRTV
jgi:methylmalonyl-CoA/ethylmalonyl-CoA epimerase